MIRRVIFILTVVLFTVVLAIPVILIGIFNPYTKFSRKIVRLWCRILIRAAGIKVEMEGLENVDLKRSYVVVSNHQSHLDIPVILYYLPLHYTVVSKKELFKIPFFGWGMKAVGILKIDRRDRAQSIATLQKAEDIIVKEGLSLLMFPEGTRSRDGKLQAFKKGPFVLAIRTGLPILPVTIIGTHHILPKGSIRVKPGHIKLIIHPPMETTGYTIEDKDKLRETVHQTIGSPFYDKRI